MESKQKNAVIIVAGGSGKRMQSTVPKQFLKLNNRTILGLTLERFHRFDSTLQIVVVLPPDQVEYWHSVCLHENITVPHSITIGGHERFFSVKNGISIVDERCRLIAVHDGVRPFISQDLLKRCFDTASELGNAVPAICPPETVRFGNFSKSEILDRNSIFLIQTPQVFLASQLLEAYQKQYSPSFTDDASVVESHGIDIHMVEGDRSNIKITSPLDLIIGEALLKNIEF
ncbi:MAG TPA: 2-C-methyl-D-erythritol 4-phosphate cytidylyltransferase [Salinivirgaceae bacterium]|nr:2-C-methyl-D-erythritol 4-phosphate cytidylyltransferase [Salinivirgaceae bacterium]